MNTVMMDVTFLKAAGFLFVSICYNSLINLCPQKHLRLQDMWHLKMMNCGGFHIRPEWPPGSISPPSQPQQSLTPDSLSLGPGMSTRLSATLNHINTVTAARREICVGDDSKKKKKNPPSEKHDFTGVHILYLCVMPKQLTCIKIKRTTKASCVSMFYFTWILMRRLHGHKW